MKKGISLITIVLTIIIIIIIASAVILTLNNSSILDQGKKARFMNDFRTVEEGVNLYSVNNIDSMVSTGKVSLPLKDKLTLGDKREMSSNMPTLKLKVEELTGKDVDAVDLYWIDLDIAGISNISKEKEETGYIIDIDTKQIYDYQGEMFKKERWHTLDGGVEEIAGMVDVPDEMWDGYITLTLYYPSNSTDRQWRLGTEGELRTDPLLMWQKYTGSIIIPMDRVQDVWIKYKINNETITVPPAGTLLVDIEPEQTTSKVEKIKVQITYDAEAEIKEYRVGNSGWLTYEGEFTVTENCVIEARAVKYEKVYNQDGTLITTVEHRGKDLVYINNIGVEESDLIKPNITRQEAEVENEVAKVKIDYPENAIRKIYKINYGTEQEYTDRISVNTYGTHIIAYYYDASGKRSKADSIVINKTITGAEPYEQIKPGDEATIPSLPTEPSPGGIVYTREKAPTININPPTSLVTEVEVSLSLPGNAKDGYIKTGRYGNYEKYQSQIRVRENTDIYAYYITYNGEKSEISHERVVNIKSTNKPHMYINASPYPYTGSYGAKEVTVNIVSSSADKVEYSEDGVEWKQYTAPFVIKENKRIYALATNEYGTKDDMLDITNIGSRPTIKKETLGVNINVNPEPLLTTTPVSKVMVSIEYDEKAEKKTYKIGANGNVQEYTEPFEITKNSTIYAYAKSERGAGQDVKLIDNIVDGIAVPIITQKPKSTIQASTVNITIKYDKNAIIKRYSINGGQIKDYTGPFDVTENGEIYAYSENTKGQKADNTLKITSVPPKPPVLVLDKGDYYILKLNYPKDARNPEYKWQENGDWKDYKEAGILLIKPQYKDKVIENGTLVKIEDETGEKITFQGDYYLIDVPISEVLENISMRWSRTAPQIPQIFLNPETPTKELKANILYDNSMVKKEYKIVDPEGKTEGWKEYKGEIAIARNNTIIYARRNG
ncbi:MAG: hypothetical protein PHR25_06655 [Clostridia bacterium]|nr:hypothetical protein [Clostridia bacterium]